MSMHLEIHGIIDIVDAPIHFSVTIAVRNLLMGGPSNPDFQSSSGLYFAVNPKFIDCL